MGWVYLLEAKIEAGRGMSLVKIGMSNKPDFHDRVSSIQKEWRSVRKTEVAILAIEKCQDALNVEQRLHQKFVSYAQTMGHIRQALGGSCSGDSEWFLVPEKLISKPNGMKYQADRLSDHPNFSDSDFPWLGIAAVLLGLFFVFGPKPAPKPVPKPAQSFTTIAAKGYAGANIRSAPNGEIVGFLANGTKVSVTARDSGWCQVDTKKWVFCILTLPAR